jgi:eukaryotic-like serine/threonine-protein kinase
MSTERDRRAAEVFKAALLRDPGERSALVREQCGDDLSLHAEVESLLDADSSAAAAFLEPPRTPWSLSGDPAQRLVDAHIGRYRICRLIAAGGMGAVYEAVQDQPSRTVALKIMRHGIASRSALRRFEYESQFLARLRHPGIAQVIDAGMHDDGSGGVPYFVMEYIPNARTITQYVHDKGLSIRERLALFTQACDAVHHGHQKGVIHRDLKPANILVETAGMIKVIDFGVARATDSDLALTTLQTDVGQLVGTLQYMSPEQVEADPHDLDARSDIYSLGVVLYEMLCERLPYDVSGERVFEATRLVREQMPVRPSTVDRSLRGDLETIVLKALEKDRTRRYQSAAELAADLQRFVSHQPISARPPSVAYQLRTFARRNKALVSGVAATFFVLLAALTIVSVMAIRINHESAQRAEINGFLESLLITAEPFPLLPGAGDSPSRGANVLWVDVIDDAVKRLDAHPLNDRVAEATIRHRIGLAYFWMNKFDPALKNLQRAYDTRREILGDDNPETLESKMGLAYCKIFFFDSYEAERLAREVVESLTRTRGAADPQTLNAKNALLVTLLYLRYDTDLKQYAHEMIDLMRAHPGVRYPGLSPRTLLANTLVDDGRLDEAEKLARDTIAEGQDDDAFTFMRGYAHMVLSWVLRDRGEWTAAEAEQRRGIDIWAARARSPNLEFQLSLANMLCHIEGRREEGLSLLRDSVKAARDEHGPYHPFTANIAARAASVYFAAGEHAESERLFQDCIRSWDAGKHTPIQYHALILLEYGTHLRSRGELADAEQRLRDALQMAQSFTTEQWRRHSFKSCAPFWTELGMTCDLLGKPEEATRCFVEAQGELRMAMNPTVATRLVWVLLQSQRAAMCEPVARALVEARRAVSYSTEHQMADALIKLGRVLQKLGRLDEAEPLLREGLNNARLAHGDADALTAWAVGTLADVQQKRGDVAEAERLRRELLEATLRVHGPDDPKTLEAMNQLAWMLVGTGQSASAEPIARDAVDRYRRMEKPPVSRMIDTLDTWAVALGDLERVDEAIATLREVRERWAQSHPDGAPLAPTYQLHLGKFLLLNREYAEAETVLLECHAASKKKRDTDLTTQSAACLVRLYHEWGKPTLATPYH